MLDTSRIEAGTFSFSFTDVDVGQLVRGGGRRGGVAQDEVRVDARSTGELPAVRGDRERLRQVLANLIDNAVKYSAPGGRVEVSAHSHNGAVQVVVRDEGSGIALDQQRVIFEKFGRAEGPLQARYGTRPLHRALDRGGARRLARRPFRARARRDLHAQPAARVDAKTYEGRNVIELPLSV